MSFRLHRVVGASAVALVLLWLGTMAVRVSAAARSRASDLDDVAAASRRFPGNTAYVHLLARADIIGGRPASAAQRLEAALGRNALSPGLWLELGRSELGRGELGRAQAAAAAARQRHPTSAEVCQKAAVILLEAGATAEALDALRCAVDLAPKRALRVYDLAWAVLDDGDLIRQQVVPDTAPGWRRYLWYTRRQQKQEAQAAWAGLVRHGATERDRFDYVEFLVNHGQGQEAADIWWTAYGPRGDNLVFNGSFEDDSRERGLDCLLRPCDGARTALRERTDAPDGRRVLEVRFHGTNVAYEHAFQRVPVAGGRRYQLRASVRTEELTGRSGPRLTVRGHGGCSMSRVEGEELLGTRPWSVETVTFTTPLGCSSVAVMLRREPTERFDKNIRGRLWLDDVRVVPMQGAPV
jgi:tetratricopeptide (TPR) repeat protein